MKKLNFLSTALLFSASLNATTIYYNGENNDIGAWSIGPNSLATSALTELHDDTLNSTVMSFTDGGQYRLRLPGNGVFWENTTERILSLDMNLDSDFTLDVFVQTNQGLRQLFFNRLNLNAGHHNSGILGGIGHNRLFRTGAGNSGWGNHPEHRNNRDGWVRVTLDLERQLRDIEPDNRVVSVLSLRIAGTSGRIDNVTLDRPNRTTRGVVVNEWRLTPNTIDGGSINAVQDNEDRGMVIEFEGVANSNSFITGAREGNERWDDRVHNVIQWKMQTLDPYKFIVHINTTNGLREMVYHGGKQRSENDEWWLRPLSAIEERGLEAENGEIYIGLGIRRHLGDDSPDNNDDGIADYDSGTGVAWQTFTRNLATDVAEFENGNQLIAINGVTVVGTNTFEHDSPMIESTIRIDDIQLFTAVEPTGENPPPATNEEATDLHQWRLRDNSVRISFRDNATGESGFSFINADTGEDMNRDLAPLNGTGREGLGQLNGLTSGTTYRIQVQTNFDDERESILSEPISITTTGDAPDEGDEEDQEATDLHQWRLRDNSVRISFTDNATSETGFSFINADNNQPLGADLPAIEGSEESGIGQINGLTAGTTYRVRVRTNFANGKEPLLSEAIQFTTTGTPPPPPNANEEATDLHRWRLRENSVRVSFVDNANGETGFRYINADTGVQMGDPLPATSGTGQSSIGQINGLIEGTTYHIQVQTLFNDGRATATSETLTFRTLGDAPNNNEDAATNLHTWRLRATSVKISFNDNAQGETGFKFINADTNAQLGNTLPAREGTGTSSIGRINGLHPATTYRVRVETLFNNGHQNALSEIIEFRTPSH